MIALIHVRDVRPRRLDIEAHLDLAAFDLTCEPEARVLEHPQHRAVSRHHDGDESLDAHACGEPGQLLEQSRPYAVALELVGNRERDLRRRRVP